MSNPEHTCESCGCSLTSDYFSDVRCNSTGIGVCLCEACCKHTSALSNEEFAAGAWRLRIITSKPVLKRPSFTHEELEALWHAVPGAQLAPALTSALDKLQTYMDLYRATRGNGR
jgi:hypothetical protein